MTIEQDQINKLWNTPTNILVEKFGLGEITIGDLERANLVHGYHAMIHVSLAFAKKDLEMQEELLEAGVPISIQEMEANQTKVENWGKYVERTWHDCETVDAAILARSQITILGKI